MKLGIALGAGGAKGFAHVGVLNVFQEAGIVFDTVSGTSIGALVGAFYAEDRIKHLEKEIKKIKRWGIPGLLTPAFSTKGIFSGGGIQRFLSHEFGEKRIEDLKKRYSAVCVDLRNSQVVTFTEGDLVQAIRASMAIPGFFTPIINGKQLLVDGGTLEPLPVRAARESGSDIVVAIDLISKSCERTYDDDIVSGLMEVTELTGLRKLSEYIVSFAKESFLKGMGVKKHNRKSSNHGMVSILQRSFLVNQRQMISYCLERYPAEIVIKPDLTEVGVFDYHRAEEIIEIGRESAESVLPELKDLLKRTVSSTASFLRES